MSNVDRFLEELAQHQFGCSLVEQKSDRLDFHELHVVTLKAALKAAYEQGVADAKNAK